MTRDDIIDVLTVVAAATRRTIGETDVLVWQGVIGDLDKQSCMQAVTDHLRERPGVWLEPGHVRERVRAKRRDALDRESDAQRDARQKALEYKIREAAQELAERKGIPAAEPKHRQRVPNPLTVRCPWCHANPGYRCVVPRTDTTMTGYHPSRIELLGGGAA